VDEAQRVHQALETAAERFAGALERARFERREGYTFLAFPTFPIRAINGVWADTDAAAPRLEGALREAEELGIPFAVRVRKGRTPKVEEAARALGFVAAEKVPGMVVTPDQLREPPAQVEIVRVQTADEVERSLTLAAAGFGVPADVIRPVYTLDFIRLEGWAYYLASAGRDDVSVAAGFTVDRSVGIFNVATPAEHRSRGYGGAITAHAVRAGFAAGADFAYLESSAMGESVYRRLGFREVETYTILTRPRKLSASS
jgi:ribosomal protein S18 acetylase RimI-like enzyme